MEDFRSLSIEELGGYLQNKSVSDDAIEALKENKVSGLALLLVSESELKDLLPTIGDRAIVRSLLSDIKGHRSTITEDVAPVNRKVTTNFDSDSSDFEEVQEDGKYGGSRSPSDDDDEHSVVEELDDPKCKKSKKEIPQAIKNVPILSKRGHEPPLPSPYVVPQNFPQAIMNGLENKKLIGKPRTKFITIIAQSIYRYKSYPTDMEYFHVAQELAKKWPFLDGGKGIKYLVVAMRMRMAYLRKPDNMKRGNPSTERQKPARKMKPTMPAVPAPNLLPVGEDDASQLRHSKLLKSELKKVNPNKRTVRELMKRTFPLRREEIVEGMGSVQDVLSSYAALKYPEEIILEFSRIMEKDMNEAIMDSWNNFVPKILDMCTDSDSPGLQHFLDLYSLDEVSDGYRSILALCSLVYLIPDVRTKVDHNKVAILIEDTAIVAEELPNLGTTQPCLIVRKNDSGQIKDVFLVIEKLVINKVEVNTAILVLFSSFFVFNVNYPPGCSNFYTLLECIFLNKQIQGRKPRLAAILAELTVMD